ncbi:MAG: Holliday junction branch migration protein RuvA, partial [Anaerolineales bacterium]|nr:Holliday junction branch migration protein RuvA [Anaerolineales bacterium]
AVDWSKFCFYLLRENMIASIQGKVLFSGDDNLVIDVGGIGYLVYVPYILPTSLRRGEKVSLFTHLVVREDSLTLFGFQDQEEVSLFQELIKVNGVGPRLALETLSTHSPDVIKRAVLNKQEEIFSQVSGIGKKTAQKILLSLEDRISFEDGFMISPETAGINSEVQEALISLGYSVLEAQAALQMIPDEAPLDLETRLTIALRHFS